MMMMDLLADHGLRAACSWTICAARPDGRALQIARKIAARPGVKAILFQTVLASRSLAERVEALLAWIAADPLPKPLFVGIAAGHAAARKMSAEEAVARLGTAGIRAFTDPVDCCARPPRRLGRRHGHKYGPARPDLFTTRPPHFAA